MITLIAKIKAKKGNETDLVQGLAELIKKVETEEGTLQYILHKSLHDPCSFLFYEVYKDNDAIVSHSSTDYFKKAMKAIFPFLDGKPEIETYEEVGRINK